MASLRPKPRRERLRPDQITALPKLQLRAYENGATFDPEYVAYLREVLKDGGEFDALEVVEELRKGKEPHWWLIDGFNRLETLRLEGAPSVECLVYSGALKDAELWALASNAKHGRQRTAADCQKAFDRLMSNTLMLDDLIRDRNRFGGTERALAAVCGIANGVAHKYLTERGLRVDRLTGKIIPRDGPESLERQARQELVGECAQQGKTNKETAAALGVSPQTVAKDKRSLREAAAKKTGAKPGAARASENLPLPIAASADTPPAEPAPAQSAPEKDKPKVDTEGDVMLAAAQDVITDINKLLREVARKSGDLLRSKVGDKLRRLATMNAVPVKVEEKLEIPDVRPRDAAKGQIGVMKRVESWPALTGLMATFSGLLAELAQDQYAREAGN